MFSIFAAIGNQALVISNNFGLNKKKTKINRAEILDILKQRKIFGHNCLTWAKESLEKYCV